MGTLLEQMDLVDSAPEAKKARAISTHDDDIDDSDDENEQ